MDLVYRPYFDYCLDPGNSYPHGFTEWRGWLTLKHFQASGNLFSFVLDMGSAFDLVEHLVERCVVW